MTRLHRAMHCMMMAEFYWRVGMVNSACRCWHEACRCCPCAAGAEELQEEEAQPIEPMMVFGSFDVSDLVGETAGNNARVGPSEQRLVRQLIRHIESTIQPGSWESQGGKGGIDYNADTNSLVVRHTDAVQQQVAGVLESLRQQGVRRAAWFAAGEPTGAERVAVLLDRCHRELMAGRTMVAQQLLRQALALDREAVMAHPLVYKMQLLHQVLSEPESLHPRMPGVDPGVIRAYNEILDQAPKKSVPVRPASLKKEEKKPAALEVQEEACELEIVPDRPACAPTICVDRDGQRLRVQVQFGAWTFKLVDEGNGKSSFSIGCTLFDRPQE